MRVLPRNESVFEAEIAEKDVTNVAELRSFDKRNGGPFPQKKGQKFLRRTTPLLLLHENCILL